MTSLSRSACASVSLRVRVVNRVCACIARVCACGTDAHRQSTPAIFHTITGEEGRLDTGAWAVHTPAHTSTSRGRAKRNGDRAKPVKGWRERPRPPLALRHCFFTTLTAIFSCRKRHGSEYRVLFFERWIRVPDFLVSECGAARAWPLCDAAA